jgi:uncharacterized Zn finger protein
VAAYARLRDWSQRAGRWGELRPKALDLLHENVERATTQTSPTARAASARRWGTAQRAQAPELTLIEVLLGDGELDEAWRLAQEHGCDSRLWMALARSREQEHPLDTVIVYQREIEDLIDRQQAHWYEQAVDLVVHVGELYARGDAEDGFATYLDDLRARHKRRTKFMAMLDAALRPPGAQVQDKS